MAGIKAGRLEERSEEKGEEESEEKARFGFVAALRLAAGDSRRSFYSGLACR